MASRKPKKAIEPPPGYSSERGADGHFIPLQQGVVEGVGIGIAAGLAAENASLAQRLSDACTDAVVAAQAEGVTDPDEIRARILAARDRVLAG